MLKTLKKVTGIILATAILLSVCAVCFGTFDMASALSVENYFTELQYNKFDDLSEIYASRNADSNKLSIVKDPVDASNNVLKFQGAMNTLAAPGKDGGVVYLEQGKRYKVTFKYKFGNGAYDYKLTTTTTGDETTYAVTQRVLQFTLSYTFNDGTNKDDGRQKADAGTALATITYDYVAANDFVTKTAKEGYEYKVLDGDTEWVTYTHEFNWGKDSGTYFLGLREPWEGLSTDKQAQIIYFDDFKVETYDVAKTYNNQYDIVEYNFDKQTGVTHVRGNNKPINYVDDGNGGYYFQVISDSGTHAAIRLASDSSNGKDSSQSSTTKSYKISKGVTYNLSAKIGFAAGQSTTNKTFYIDALLCDSSGGAKKEGNPTEFKFTDFGFADPDGDGTYTVEETKWTTISLKFTVNASEVDGGCLYLRVRNPFTNAVVLFDDVVMMAEPRTITLDGSGGATNKTITIPASAKLSAKDLGTPVSDNKKYTFIGWYTDANYTTAVTYPYTPASNTTLYAKWDKGPIQTGNVTYNFEDVTALSNDDLRFTNGNVKLYTEGNGNKCVLFPSINGGSMRLNSDLYGMYQLQSNTEYQITFKYKFADSESTMFTFGVNRFHENTINGNKYTYADCGANINNKIYQHNTDMVADANGWYTGTFKFTTGDVSDKKHTLAIRNGARDSSDPENSSTVYIDDVSIMINPCVITLDDGLGANKTVTVSKGESVSADDLGIPTTDNAFLSFAGWYTSADYKAKVKFPYEVTSNVTLYARWIQNHGVNLNLDNGTGIPLTFRQGGNKAEYITDPSGRGGKSLKVTIGNSVELQFGSKASATVASTIGKDNDGYWLVKDNKYVASYQVMIPAGTCLGTSYDSISLGFATVRQVAYASNTFGQNISPNGGTTDRFYKLDLSDLVKSGDVYKNESDGKYYVKNNTPWYTVSVSFAASDKYLINHETNGVSKYLIMRASAENGTVLVFDNFQVEQVFNGKYTYNWINDETGKKVTVPAGNIGNGLNGSVNDGGGVTITGIRGVSITNNCYGNNTGGLTVGQFMRSYIIDPDVNNGNKLRVEAGKTYVVTAKFKAASASNTQYGLAIGLANTTADNEVSATVDQYDIYSYKTVTYTDDEGWTYITKIIDGDAKSPTSNGAKPTSVEAVHDHTYNTANYIKNDGRNIVLVACNTNTSGIIVEKVDVVVYDNIYDEKTSYSIKEDENLAVKIDTKTNEPTIYKLQNGYKIADLPGVNINQYGEIGQYVSGGVINQKGEFVEKVTENIVFTGGSEYVIEYPTLSMDNNSDIPKESGANGTVAIVDSADIVHGNVAQMTVSTKGDYCAVGFGSPITADMVGKRIYGSVEVKVINKVSNGDIKITMLKDISQLLGDGKLDIKEIAGKTAISADSASEWTTIGFSFVVDETYVGYYPVFEAKGVGSGSVIWFDNYWTKLVNVPVDASATGKSVKDVKNSIRYEATVNGKYQSAGIRFRGTINVGFLGSKPSKVGFVVLPAALAAQNQNWYKQENWETSGAMYIECTDKIYSQESAGFFQGTNYSYQLLLSGLTRKGNANNSVALATEMTAKMYTVDSRGNYTYYDVNTTSYNEVKAAYRTFNAVTTDEYAKYNGLPSTFAPGSKAESITINGYSIDKFTIVRDYTTRSFLIQDEIANIQQYIRNKTYAYVGLEEDRFSSEHEFEISVGNTNRAGVKAESSYTYDQYEIIISGKKVYLLGGSSYAVQTAVTEFAAMLQKGAVTDADSKKGSYKSTVKGYDKTNYYSYLWGDEFDGDELDTDKWIIRDFETKVKYDEEGNIIGGTSHVKNDETFEMKDGNLIMRAYPDEDGPYDYINCDAIKSDPSMYFNQGYLEMRARIPDGKGVYSSFWTVGNEKDGGGERLELDIFESLGSIHKQQANIHKWASQANGGHTSLDSTVGDRAYKLSQGSLFDDYHTIGLLWNETEVKFYYDGILFYSQPTDEYFLDKYLYIIAGFNVGWPERTPPAEEVEFPLEYHIDYIRLYQTACDDYIVRNNPTYGKEDDDWKSHPEDYKLIALTFDDAPSHSTATGNSTTTIVDTLNKYDGAGTLFVVGQTLESKGPAVLQYALDRGFELGNHTYSHRSVLTDDVGKTWTAAQNKEDFQKCQDLVYQQLGINMKWLRPSGVHTNDAVFQACAELGLPCIIRDTSVATNDWNSATTQEQIEDAVINNAYDGAIVLMHSPNANTAAALEKICSTLYAQGYRFCTLSELFELRGVDYEDVPYYKGINGYNQEQGFIYAQ